VIWVLRCAVADACDWTTRLELTQTATADADPLGVDMNVTFDNVGGLDGRESTLAFAMP
jgi:hypothetical protein